MKAYKRTSKRSGPPPPLAERPTLDLFELATRHGDAREHARQIAGMLLAAEKRLAALGSVDQVEASARVDEDLALIERVYSAAITASRQLAAASVRHLIWALDTTARPRTVGPDQPAMVVSFTSALNTVGLGEVGWRLLKDTSLIELLHDWADPVDRAAAEAGGLGRYRRLSETLALIGIDVAPETLARLARR